MAEDNTRPASSGRETTAITGSGEFRKGAQVVETTGMPEGYVPPSASLPPPPSAPPPLTPASNEASGNAQAGDSS